MFCNAETVWPRNLEKCDQCRINLNCFVSNNEKQRTQVSNTGPSSKKPTSLITFTVKSFQI